MSESLVGKVLHGVGPLRGGLLSNTYCLVLEESEHAIVAVLLRSDSDASSGWEWPRPEYERSGEPFAMSKVTETGAEGQSRTVARVSEGDNEGDYSVWDGHAQRAFFFGY